MTRKAKDEARNVSPDDEAACLAEYGDLKAESARINQRIATMLGRYEKLGVDRKGIKHCYKMSLETDAQSQHERQSAMLARLGIIKLEWDSSGQASAVALRTPSPDAMAKLAHGRVKVDGYNTGYAGGLKDGNPHEPGQELHVVWLKGWYEGAADRTENKPEAADITKPEPRKRGGRKKADTAPGGEAIH